MALQTRQRAAGLDANRICEPPKTPTIQASPAATGNSLRLTNSPRLRRGSDRAKEKKDVNIIADTSAPFPKGLLPPGIANVTGTYSELNLC